MKQSKSANPFDQWSELLELWHGLVDVEDKRFYQLLAKRFNRPTVELGIGDGRVAATVAPDYGVDFSPVMLEKCRKRLGTSCPYLIEADLKLYHLPERAGFSYAPLNTISHIEPNDRETVFRTILQNTKPGGYFAFDTIVPDLDKIKMRDRAQIYRGRTNSFAIYEVSEVKSYERQEFVLHGIIESIAPNGEVTGKRYFPELSFFYMFPEQIRSLVERTGWQIESVWGDFDETPLTEESRMQIWLLKHPESR
ncbi:class I SAM-dependent methyltransferase [Thermoflavimicrobium daqui]|jgi:SAM-dependent methyltransferase|uniref:Methyltransferase domain-containing protein n=1 Tax=Thermoflavimicrobium daqui TaxID=2137476 RepID=A0A364K4C5_9BACL|nr:class I SAM-dependent methyltransferase [Thermoflavimicrobium daqui]RAL24238.1 hypothetical protein DL897_11200 [Thermoflavimicrobium daqui]